MAAAHTPPARPDSRRCHGRSAGPSRVHAIVSVMRVRFLGTSTSYGVPVIGCRCATCCSTDPRNKRTRASVYLESDEGVRLLIDSGPELRVQALREGVTRLDAVLAASRALLHDLDVVVVDALRWEPHPTHLSVPEALELIADIQPRHAYLTHVGHTLEHETTNLRVGPDVEVAFDGLELTLAR